MRSKLQAPQRPAQHPATDSPSSYSHRAWQAFGLAALFFSDRLLPGVAAARGAALMQPGFGPGRMLQQLPPPSSWHSPMAEALCAKPSDVVINRVDLANTNAQLCENALTPQSVRNDSFGVLYRRQIGGAQYGQTLTAQDVFIDGAQYDIFLTADATNTVCVFDANDTSVDADPLWQTTLCQAPTPQAFGASDLFNDASIGILSTPLIDRCSNTVFAVTLCDDDDAYTYLLHALDLSSGTARPGSPWTFQGGNYGSGIGAKNGVISFDAAFHLQRPGLGLAGNKVIINFASHNDYRTSTQSYQGWTFAFDIDRSAFLDYPRIPCPASEGCGIWQGGAKSAYDEASGRIFSATGNGFGSDPSASDRPESIIAQTIGERGVDLVDAYTPDDWEQLDEFDRDLGTSGPVLPPGTQLVQAVGKEGVLYSALRQSLGGILANDSGGSQKIPVSGRPIFSTPVFYDSPIHGKLLYTGGIAEPIKVFRLNETRVEPRPVMQSSIACGNGQQGWQMGISANGEQNGSAILWAISSVRQADSRIPNDAGGNATLHAFDADTLEPLAAIPYGRAQKFSPPTISRGKVFLTGADGSVVVLGLNATAEG